MRIALDQVGVGIISLQQLGMASFHCGFAKLFFSASNRFQKALPHLRSNFAGHIIIRPAGGSTYLGCSCACKKHALRSWKIRVINLSHTPLEVEQLWASMQYKITGF